MTEILLDVTSEDISRIAHSVYDKAKAHALKGRCFWSVSPDSQEGNCAVTHRKSLYWKQLFTGKKIIAKEYVSVLVAVFCEVSQFSFAIDQLSKTDQQIFFF